MRSKRRIIIAIVILVAAPLALLMAMGCLPEMTYQGVLTDASGNPVSDGTYTMQFQLWNPGIGAYVFSQTGPVTVTNGVFNVVLGDATANPLPVGQFGMPLELEITVNGDLLTPTQQLLGAPYAFSLAAGAVIYNYDGSGAPVALTISNAGSVTSPTLRLEGGALQSDQYSFLWIPASLGNTNTPTVLDVSYYDPGGVYMTRSSQGTSYFILPMQLPGVLYGQNVTVDAVTIYYQCSGSHCGSGGTNTRIDATALRRQVDPNSEESLASELTDHFSTAASGDFYPLSPDYEIGSTSSGIMAIRWTLYFHDADDQIRISGVRVRLIHQ